VSVAATEPVVVVVVVVFETADQHQAHTRFFTMAERKVLNKYIPPDFDPSKLPKKKAARNASDQQKVRTMLPMSVRCSTCGNYMSKGTKFNVRMELVKNEDYLGMKIFRFYYKCKNCAAEFCMKTDPKSADYIVEAGATRNYEAGKEAGKLAEERRRKKEAEEKGDAMKALENRTLDSKRELEMANALDEMKTLRSRHERVDFETALRRVRGAGGAGGAGGMSVEAKLDEADEVQVQMMLLQQERARRVGGGSSSSSSGGGGSERGDDGEVAPSGPRPPPESRPSKQQSLAKRLKVVKKKESEDADQVAGVVGGLFGGYGGSDSEGD